MVEVGLSGPSKASLYNTTDGSELTTSSTFYTAPLTLMETTTLKAKAFHIDYTPSTMTSGLYPSRCRTRRASGDGDGIWLLTPADWERVNTSMRLGHRDDRAMSQCAFAVGQNPGQPLDDLIGLHVAQAEGDDARERLT